MATEFTCKHSKWSEYRMEYRASNKCLINIRPVTKYRCDATEMYVMQQNGIDDSTSFSGDFTIYFK